MFPKKYWFHADFSSASRFRLLESRLEETVQQTMRIKEEKISSLEKKVEESNTVNATLLAELASVRTHIHAPKSLFLVSYSVVFFTKTSLFDSDSSDVVSFATTKRGSQLPSPPAE